MMRIRRTVSFNMEEPTVRFDRWILIKIRC